MEKPVAPWGDETPVHASEIDAILANSIEYLVTLGNSFENVIGRDELGRDEESALEYLSNAMNHHIISVENQIGGQNERWLKDSYKTWGADVIDWVEFLMENVPEVTDTIDIICTWKKLRYSSYEQAVISNDVPSVDRMYRRNGKVRIYTAGPNLHGQSVTINNVQFKPLRERGVRGKIFDTSLAEDQ